MSQHYTYTVDEGFKCMHLLQNQQESMCLKILDILKYQYEIDHTHVFEWVRVIKDESSFRAHGVTN